MKKKLFKVGTTLALVIGILFSFQVIKAATEIVGTMANKEANNDEVFNQNRLNSQGDAFIDVIDSELLAKDYSYEKNKKVKAEVDKKIKEMKDSGVDYASEYGVENELELLKVTGDLLKIQEDAYVKDQYEKNYITDASLKALYDQRKGELVSYAIIKVDDASLENDEKKISDAKKDIEAKIKAADKKELKQIFKELNEKYPTSDASSGEFDSASRENVEENLLKQIDKMKYLEVTKTPVVIDDQEYYILKTSKDERTSFEASKEKLKTIQYDEAMQNNQYFADYILMELRNKNKIDFKSESDKKVYNAANQKIVDGYNKAKKAGDE